VTTHSVAENGGGENNDLSEETEAIVKEGRKVTTLWSLYSVFKAYFLCAIGYDL